MNSACSTTRRLDDDADVGMPIVTSAAIPIFTFPCFLAFSRYSRAPLCFLAFAWSRLLAQINYELARAAPRRVVFSYAAHAQTRLS